MNNSNHMKDTPLPPAYKKGDEVIIKARVARDFYPNNHLGVEVEIEVDTTQDNYAIQPQNIVQPPKWQKLTLLNMPQHGQLCVWLTVDEDEHGNVRLCETTGSPRQFVRTKDGWYTEHYHHLLLEPYTQEACDGYYWYPLPPLPIKQ
jgi:hypothetical protein